MNTPTISAISAISAKQGTQFINKRHYKICHAGGFQGTWWEAGTVVTLDDNVQAGGTLLLAPRRRGTPRFGTIVGGVIRGSAGEPCSPLRWRVVGRVIHDIQPKQLSLFS
jgi:hypothetical protein